MTYDAETSIVRNPADRRTSEIVEDAFMIADKMMEISNAH